MSEKNEEVRYHLTYTLKHHPKGLTKAEVEALGDVGACDKIVLHSIIDTPDGGSSTMIVGLDGKKDDDLSPEELFKQWTLLTKHVADKLPPGNRKDFCERVFEEVRMAVLLGREQQEGG